MNSEGIRCSTQKKSPSKPKAGIRSVEGRRLSGGSDKILLLDKIRCPPKRDSPPRLILRRAQAQYIRGWTKKTRIEEIDYFENNSGSGTRQRMREAKLPVSAT